MTEKSTYLEFPYPSEGTDPWYSDFQNAFIEIDSLVFMQKIQNNLFADNTGTFNLSGDSFTWTQDFIIPIFYFGFKLNVKFGPDGSNRQCSLVDGAALVIDIPFSMKANKDVNLEPKSQLTNLAHNQWALGWRSGNRVFIKGMGRVYP